jgi:hypothetical protein
MRRKKKKPKNNDNNDDDCENDMSTIIDDKDNSSRPLPSSLFHGITIVHRGGP